MTELIKNEAGGINDMAKNAIERAKKVDLITFPSSVSGTNCFNCRFIQDKMKGYGYCTNKEVAQYVNGQMCCNRWDLKGTYRPFKKEF